MLQACIGIISLNRLIDNIQQQNVSVHNDNQMIIIDR